jgi:hypothetical protein
MALDDKPSSAAEEPKPEPHEPSSGDKPTPKSDHALSTSASNAEPRKKRKKKKKDRESRTAVISVAGTLLGAIVAGGFGLWINHSDRNREAESAQTSFIHAQRVAAYTAFANAYNELRQAADKEQLAIRGEYPNNTSAVGPPPEQDVDTSYSRLWNAYDLVSFVGSTPAEDTASKVVDKAVVIKQFIFEWGAAHPNLAAPRTAFPTDSLINERQSFLDQSYCLIADLDDADQKFNNAGRNDLGLPPLPYSPFQRPPSCAHAASEPH